jgi:serine/threonine protein phosphatase PrpC
LEDSRLPGIGLQMARALGDAALDRVLNREPDLLTVELGAESVVLVASDGLLLPLAPADSQLEILMERVRQGADAEALVQAALAAPTGDNVTVLVWKAQS